MLTFYLAFYLTYILTFYLWNTWHIFWQSIWHSFWHSVWHMFWHSIWQSFWHSISHVFGSSRARPQGPELAVWSWPRRAHSIRTLQYGVRLQACQHSELATWGSGPGVLRSLRGWRWGSGHKAQQGRRWGEGGGVVPLLKSGDPHWQVWKNKTCLSLSLFPLSA